MDKLRAAAMKQWHRLSLRERWIATATFVVFVFMLWNLLFYVPVNEDILRVEQEIAEVDGQLAEMRVKQAEMQRMLTDDPDRENRAQLEKLTVEAAELDRKLERVAVQILQPQDMNRLLRTMLEQQDALQFVSLSNKPATPAFTGSHADGEAASEDPISIYRHSVVLEVKGSYENLLAYLKTLESLQWRFFWQGIEIETQDYPDALITLEVYTLGFRKGVVGA